MNITIIICSLQLGWNGEGENKRREQTLSTVYNWVGAERRKSRTGMKIAGTGDFSFGVNMASDSIP